MPPKFFSWIFFYIFLTLLITLGIVLFWPGRGLLLPVLTPKPETFTELYFEDHLDLPKRVVEGQPYDFSFTIHNLEGKNVNYPIEVTAINEATPSSFSIFKGAVVVDDQQTKTVPVSYAIPAGLGERVKVQVLLKNLNQSIHFWVETISTQSAVAKGMIFISSASAKPTPFLIPDDEFSSPPATTTASPQILVP